MAQGLSRPQSEWLIFAKAFPKPKPIAPYLFLAGDIGKPDDHNFKDFMHYCNNNWTKTFYVFGNHDVWHKTKHLNGDIVECGVFKGSGIYTFLKLKRLFNPNSSKRVVGFDFFNTEELLKQSKKD